MNFFGINKYFDTTDKPESYKRSGRAMTIWMMIVIAISMVAVWGNVVKGSISIGIDAYIYNGWKALNKADAGSANYILFSILVGIFVITLGITYFLGIKAFVKGLRSLSNNEDSNIFPYFFIIALVNFFYFNFGAKLGTAAFDMVNSEAGWGSVLSGIIFVPAAIGILIFCLSNSYDSERIPEFVGRLFIAATVFLGIGIMCGDLNGFFASSANDVGIWQTFMYASSGAYTSEVKTAFALQGVLAILIYFAAFYTVFQTVVLVCADYGNNKKTTLIAPLILFCLVTIALFTNGITYELIVNPTKVTVDADVISSFVCVVILTTINLTNYFINAKQ